MSTKLTLKTVRNILAVRDMNIAERNGEYRVTYAPCRMQSAAHREASAYYTADLEDAKNTGLAMADELDSLEGKGN